MERIRFYRLLMRSFFCVEMGICIHVLLWRWEFQTRVFLSAEFGSKRLLVECGNSAELELLVTFIHHLPQIVLNDMFAKFLNQ